MSHIILFILYYCLHCSVCLEPSLPASLRTDINKPKHTVEYTIYETECAKSNKWWFLIDSIAYSHVLLLLTFSGTTDVFAPKEKRIYIYI